jgi:hypothetical protein
MTGRERILSAFSREGASEVGVVAAYENIFIRDHWPVLTSVPWWYAFSGLADEEVSWSTDFFTRSGLEWLTVWPCPSRAERSRYLYEQREGAVWLVDRGTGGGEQLAEPMPGGTNTASASSKHTNLESLPRTRHQVDALVPPTPLFEWDKFLAEGRNDTAVAISETLDLLLYGHISSPIWALYGLLGYEGMMVFLGQSPELASYTGRKILAGVVQSVRMISALGAEAVWIEECLTDQISPELFRDLNVPLLRECVEEIRALGMKSVYYYCGDPNDRFEDIMDVGADAIHFEESKKDFTVDIGEVVRRVNGRCVVFGNLDAISVLQNGSEEVLRSEIRRQLEAGRRNGGRFIMSTGSPITPGTSVERVRLYTDLVRQSSRL